MYAEKLSQLVTPTAKQKLPIVRFTSEHLNFGCGGCKTPLRACGLTSTLHGALLTTSSAGFSAIYLETHGDTVPRTSKKMESRGSAIYFEITWLYLLEV